MMNKQISLSTMTALHCQLIVNCMGMSSLTYSPIAITDSGWITTTVTVYPSEDSFIQPITTTSFYSLHVEGKTFRSPLVVDYISCNNVKLLISNLQDPHVTIMAQCGNLWKF